MAEEPEENQIIALSVGTLEDPNWESRSIGAEDLTPHFSFLLSRTAYVGDPNSAEQIRSGQYDRQLRLPELAARDPLRPRVAEVLGHEAELAEYYRQLRSVTGQGPRPDAVGYWLSLRFVSEQAGKEVGFPWWDRVSDAAPFCDWLRTAADGEDYFDADQGWMLRAVRKRERLHLQHSDLDTKQEFSNVSVGRETFLARLDTAELQARTVIAKLKRRLGIDPWS